MLRLSLAVCLVLLSTTIVSRAEDAVLIDPAKVAQLHRLEPLTTDKVDVFVEAGQLTRAQADLVKRNIAGGRLILPESAVGAEPARRRAPVEAVAAPAARNPYANIDNKLSAEDREHL